MRYGPGRHPGERIRKNNHQPHHLHRYCIFLFMRLNGFVSYWWSMWNQSINNSRNPGSKRSKGQLQMTPQQKARMVIAVIVSFSCFVALLLTGSRWISIFAKTDHPAIYITIYCALSGVYIYYKSPILMLGVHVRSSIIHIISGEFFSLIAIILPLTNHPRYAAIDFINILHGIIETLPVIILASFVLGGWLLLPACCVVATLLLRSRLFITH